MRRDDRKRAGAAVRHGDDAGRRIEGVMPIFLLELIGQRRLLLDGKIVERLAIAVLGRKAQPGGEFAVQPVGRPVGRLVGAVAPDRTEPVSYTHLDVYKRQDNNNSMLY